MLEAYPIIFKDLQLQDCYKDINYRTRTSAAVFMFNLLSSLKQAKTSVIMSSIMC